MVDQCYPAYEDVPCPLYPWPRNDSAGAAAPTAAAHNATVLAEEAAAEAAMAEAAGLEANQPAWVPGSVLWEAPLSTNPETLKAQVARMVSGSSTGDRYRL